jgi:hypothetical protein
MIQCASRVVTLTGGRVMVMEEPAGTGADGGAVLGGSGGHLVEVGGAGQRLAVDRGYLGRRVERLMATRRHDRV